MSKFFIRSWKEYLKMKNKSDLSKEMKEIKPYIKEYHLMMEMTGHYTSKVIVKKKYKKQKKDIDDIIESPDKRLIKRECDLKRIYKKYDELNQEQQGIIFNQMINEGFSPEEESIEEFYMERKLKFKFRKKNE